MTKRMTAPATSMTSQDLRRAVSRIQSGKSYDLDCGRWPGMPLFAGHPQFQVLNYRTPRGLSNQGDQTWLGSNEVNFGWHSDLVMGTVHTGTHIDALSHVTCGHDSHWFGGMASAEHSGDFGPLRDDAAEIPSIITRGVLIDVAGHRGVDALDAHAEIGREDLEQALEAQGSEVRKGDVVLVRTGYLSAWPDPVVMAAHFQAGINVPAAEYLAEKGAIAVGGDTESLECLPSRVDGDPHPVHIALLIERGVFILEMVYLEELARDSVYEFCFICLPLKIRGATGSMVRPIALV